MQAAFLLGRLLNREVGLKYASALGWEDIWNSNVIFVGKSNVNPTIRRVLHDAGLDFIDTDHGAAVRNLPPAARRVRRVPERRRRTAPVRSTASSASCPARSRATT